MKRRKTGSATRGPGGAPHRAPARIVLLCGLVITLAACTGTQQPAPAIVSQTEAPTGVTAPGFVLPGGSGCAAEIARFQAIVDNDLATGHTTASVHGQISTQLARPRATCAAGQERAALTQLQATRSRFGYR